ncbi:hypothetical protein BJ165DRAFT_1410940 [Panaeolus papilionaceus]|nr:hypothetical protein BJ165DRAFT_1410940 [Panaeolus papilionaceus]
MSYLASQQPHPHACIPVSLSPSYRNKTRLGRNFWDQRGWEVGITRASNKNNNQPHIAFLPPQHQQHGQSQSFLGFTSHFGGSSSSSSSSSATLASPPRGCPANRPGTSSGAPPFYPSLLSSPHHSPAGSSPNYADESFLASTALLSSPSMDGYTSGYSGGGGSILPISC